MTASSRKTSADYEWIGTNVPFLPINRTLLPPHMPSFHLTASSTTTSSTTTSSSSSSAPPPPKASPAQPSPPTTQPAVPPGYRDCPEGYVSLGRKSWAFLHTLAAYFPEQPTPAHKQHATQLMQAVASLYPCRDCGEHLESVCH